MLVRVIAPETARFLRILIIWLSDLLARKRRSIMGLTFAPKTTAAETEAK
jgi:hypothetical protein